MQRSIATPFYKFIILCADMVDFADSVTNNYSVGIKNYALCYFVYSLCARSYVCVYIIRIMFVQVYFHDQVTFGVVKSTEGQYLHTSRLTFADASITLYGNW